MGRLPSVGRSLLVALVLALPCAAEQLWLTQGVGVQTSDAVRFAFSNTVYVEHGHAFSDEEAGSFRWAFAEHWAVGGGASVSQNRVETRGADPEESASGGEDGSFGTESGGHRHWDCGGRPTEHLALDWSREAGGWNFLDSNRLYFHFRPGERDWIVYRNIATVTAPPVPDIPWKPRPYLTQFVYVTDRDGYGGADRFSEFRWVAGLSARPAEHLSLAAYWQYRDIESPPGDWTSIRIAGLSAQLLF